MALLTVLVVLPGSARTEDATAGASDTPAPGWVESLSGVPWRSAGAAAFDAIVVRPVRATALLVGFGYFAITAPVAALRGDVTSSWNAFVATPYDDLVRPLGAP